MCYFSLFKVKNIFTAFIYLDNCKCNSNMQKHFFMIKWSTFPPPILKSGILFHAYHYQGQMSKVKVTRPFWNFRFEVLRLPFPYIWTSFVKSLDLTLTWGYHWQISFSRSKVNDQGHPLSLQLRICGFGAPIPLHMNRFCSNLEYNLTMEPSLMYIITKVRGQWSRSHVLL